MTDIEKILYKELYKKSLYDFIKDFWSEVDPSPFIDGVLIQFYAETFQYFCRNFIPCEISDVEIPEKYSDCDIIDVREDKRNMCLNVPPRHSKSLCISVFGCVWLWINKPIKAASISHTFALSKDLNMKRQRLINSQKFQEIFGDEIKLISNSNDLLRDNRGGELYAKNRASLLGYGVDICCADDIVNAEAAKLDRREMEVAWNFFSEVLPGRLNNPQTGIIWNIQQRLAPNDVTGRLKEDKRLRDSYCFVSLPAIFQKDTVIVYPITGSMFYFKAGEPLWVERFGDYSTLRAQLVESAWQAQYMQNPMASDATVVKENMIIEKTVMEVPEISQANAIYASHDTPVKETETSDYFGSVIGYTVDGVLYVIDALEERMGYVKSVDYIKSVNGKYNGVIQIIEDKAAGSIILQQMQEEIPGLQGFQPGTRSKVQRMESASLYLNSGNVVFVKSIYDAVSGKYNLSPNLQRLKNELLSFPVVQHDDVSDAFSQLVLFVFADKRFQVYGRTFNEANIVTYEYRQGDYSTIFFSKNGDLWRAAEIVVRYGIETKIIVMRETMFKSNINSALKKLKKFAPDHKVFIDASDTNSLGSIFQKGMIVERYEINDFAQSVTTLNLAFGDNRVLIDKSCKQTRSDISNFKYDKTKTDEMKYKTEFDGFVGCIRVALKYYGINS